MSPIEFDDWFDKHAAYFPGIRTWFGRQGEYSKDVEAVWRKDLAKCQLEDCLDASQQLYGQTESKAPFFERHAREVREIAQNLRMQRAQPPEPRYIDGEQIFGCLQCKDDGQVICWHPKVMTAAKAGTLGEPFTVYTCAVACECTAGERYARQGMPRYNAKQWRLVQADLPRSQQLKDLKDFMEASRLRPANQKVTF